MRPGKANSGSLDMTDATIQLDQTGLTLALSDSDERNYDNNPWPRDNCPPSSDTQTQDRIFEVTATPATKRAAAARVENGSGSFATSSNRARHDDHDQSH